MQTIKEKLSDMSAMRQAKAEAKEEEKAEKELAKARVEVAHEVRMAREAEAAMNLHVNKAADKAAEVDRKYQQPAHGEDSYGQLDSYGSNPNFPTPAGAGYTTDPMCGGAAVDPTGGINTTTASAAGTGCAGTRSGGRPTNHNLL